MTPLDAAMSFLWSHRCRTNFLFTGVLMLGAYAFVFDTHHDLIGDESIDLTELEQELDSSNPVHIVSYKSPLDESIFRPRVDSTSDDQAAGMIPFLGRWAAPGGKHAPAGRVGARADAESEAVKYHRVWTIADQLIDRNGLWPDSPEVDAILEAMARAPIVAVDVLDIGDYESGTAEKWIVTLHGGQKTVMKIAWESNGGMKDDAMCNTGFEMPSSEIAAFHLHRVLGFRNTPYVTGRRVNLLKEVLPHASLAVTKQIIVKPNNETCVLGKCYECKTDKMLCRRNAVFEVSLAYWVTRKLRLYTFPPLYMPFSTPRMDKWGKFGFNDKTYCDAVRSDIEPYNIDSFYYDMFDFAVIDQLMYHYDSKHYSINDKSAAEGLVVRLDHGRAFCGYDRDDDDVMLAPIRQCCKLRTSTYDKLLAVQNGALTKKLKQALDKDPIAPILEAIWYPTIERRLKLILSLVERCVEANGRNNVLVS